MSLFTGMFRPLIWKPRGLVDSLNSLGASHGVLSRSDVTATVGGPDQKHPLTVVELAGGKVVGDLRLAATRDDIVIGGLQTIFSSSDPRNHYALHRHRFRVPKFRRGTAFLLGSASSDNYYHWLLDSLPRWKILQAAQYSKYDYVLLHSRPMQYQDEMLDCLNVPPARRLRCSKNFVHQFERLVVPTTPFSQECESARWVCEWVRSFFPGKDSGPEKIFVSRRGALRRRLVNEADLERQLQAEGFISVQLDGLPVSEQARLFSSARCIVGSYGAGLTNMIFAPAKALLVELFHPDILRPPYKNLADAAGLRYAAVVGEHTDKQVYAREEKMEFKIDVPAVLRVVRENL